MPRKTSYTAADIVKLSERDHVRLRTQVFLGNMHPAEYEIPIFLNNTFEVKKLTFVAAAYKAVGEILENSVDEFNKINQRSKVLQISSSPSTGEYTIEDNGRGIPIEKHEEGKYAPEVALGELRSGRNFNLAENEEGVQGQNGVGSACTNFCSSDFIVTIHRDGKKYHQVFEDGAAVIRKPKITKAAKTKRGTKVSFTLDSQIFKPVALPLELMENRAYEIAFNNPGIEVVYNGTPYKSKKGLEEIVKTISKSYSVFENDFLKFFVIFDLIESTEEKMFTWVNSTLLLDGGICNTQFLNAFISKAITHLEPQAKKKDMEINKNNVRENLLVLGMLKVANPEYDGQSKTKLTGPNLRKEFSDLIEDNWPKFVRSNRDWLSEVVDRAAASYHTKANRKAIKDHQKILKKKIVGLLDANNKDRSKCQLLVTEGQSAASSIGQVRNPSTTASLALTGKINNVYGMNPGQVLQLGKVTELLAAIGLTPGKEAYRSELRYGKVVIATDADQDGSDIFTLVVNLFFSFWPELFEDKNNPYIYRLLAPNVVASKNGKRIHYATLNDFEKVKEKYKGWSISYMKGLGSMQQQDWKMILEDENMLLPIIDDGSMKDVLRLLFSKDAEARKGWLQK